MTRFVALLRGINVGGHRVKMDHLRALFIDMGFEDVSTFIASGNVLFTAEADDGQAVTARIEGALADSLGYGVETFLRTPEELRAVIDFTPPGHDEARSLYVAFLKNEPDGAMRARFDEIGSPRDRFTFHGREIYWSIDGKLSESPLFTGSALDKAFGDVRSTTRNITSLRRLVAKAEA